jgi:hypothetical protein
VIDTNFVLYIYIYTYNRIKHVHIICEYFYGSAVLKRAPKKCLQREETESGLISSEQCPVKCIRRG